MKVLTMPLTAPRTFESLETGDTFTVLKNDWTEVFMKMDNGEKLTIGSITDRGSHRIGTLSESVGTPVYNVNNFELHEK